MCVCVRASARADRCQGLRENESHFVREKAAVVFVEVAKREWLTSWTDMDETLHRIYDQSVSHPSPRSRAAADPPRRNRAGRWRCRFCRRSLKTCSSSMTW